jgi:hypothetical protein
MPFERGPPRIPDILFDAIVTYSEVSQVANGGCRIESEGQKGLINTAVTGTIFEENFRVESVWKKLRTLHPA